MIQEEKAKRYEEKLDVARHIYTDPSVKDEDKYYIEVIFPELKESEDEKIRKELLSFCQNRADNYPNDPKYANISNWITWLENIPYTIDHEKREGFHLGYKAALEKQGEKQQKTPIWKHWKDGIAGNGEGKPIYLIKYGHTYSLSSCLCFECDYIKLSELDKLMLEKQETSYTKRDIDDAYLKGISDAKNELEKQGEQKSADNVGPKFHEGEWVIDKQGIVHQISNVIENVTNHTYSYDIVGGGYFNDNTEGVRLWTIQDAKDGDVLASELCDSIILFKGINDDNNIDFYCDYDFSEIDLPGDRFSVNNGQHYGNVEDSKDFHPATKEQRDQLFQKMHEAGYEWSDKDRKLIKIVK